MAVAVKNMPDSSLRTERMPLATASIFGSVYVLAAIAAVAFGVPALWSNSLGPWVNRVLGSFVSGASLIVIELFAIGILGFVGVMLTGGTVRPGLKAGIATVIATVLAVIIVMAIFAPRGSAVFWQALSLILVAGILFFVLRFISGDKFDERMRAFEAQGWFTTAPYKPNQGRKVRRATTLGLLIMAGAGVWTLLHHGTLEAAASKDWTFDVPFTDWSFTLLPDIRYSIPILMIAASLWFSFRIVHWPAFADFLIATEGELNKIAWPTRRSLWQDTVVVLATVLLMTLFLFLVDMAWGEILSSRWVGILRLPEKTHTTEVADEKNQDWP